MTRSKKRLTVLLTVALCLLAVFQLFALTGCDDQQEQNQPPRERKYLEEWSEDVEFSTDYFPNIEKEPGKKFKIMLFTDLQLWGDLSANNEVYIMMDELVAEANPDLIILLGDNVSGLTTDYLLKELIAKMESYKIPWAPVFGNHDTEGLMKLDAQAQKYEEAEYCLFETGPENLYGAGNYAINITENGKAVQTLFFFDNGRYTKYEDGTEKEIYLSEEQIGWYEWTVKGMAEAEGHTVPSMTFSHFAMPQFRTAVETLCTKGENGYYYVPEELGFGYCQYLPGVAPVDSGFFAKAKELGSTTHIFCGHDHENNASILYEGIRFTYGLKTGCSPRPWNDADYYGATVIELGDSVDLYNIEKDKT